MSDSIGILYVDDNETRRRARAEMLDRYDRLRVDTATDAGDALVVLERRAVDCVVSAFRTSERDGIDFVSAIREEHPRLPVLVLIEYDHRNQIERALEAGMTDYVPITTPTNSYDLLVNRIENSVSRGHRTTGGKTGRFLRAKLTKN